MQFLPKKKPPKTRILIFLRTYLCGLLKLNHPNCVLEYEISSSFQPRVEAYLSLKTTPSLFEGTLSEFVHVREVRGENIRTKI